MFTRLFGVGCLSLLNTRFHLDLDETVLSKTDHSNTIILDGSAQAGAGLDDSFTHEGAPFCCTVKVTSSKQTMWSKISSALKARSDGEPALAQNMAQGTVMGKLLEQHPNMSVFHASHDQSLPAASPPSSPTKHGRLGLFKRNTKTQHDNSSTLSLARKVKTSLHINTNMNSACIYFVVLSPADLSVDSDMSLAPNTAIESAPPPLNSVRSIFRRNTPTAIQIHTQLSSAF